MASSTNTNGQAPHPIAIADGLFGPSFASPKFIRHEASYPSYMKNLNDAYLPTPAPTPKVSRQSTTAAPATSPAKPTKQPSAARPLLSILLFSALLYYSWPSLSPLVDGFVSSLNSTNSTVGILPDPTFTILPTRLPNSFSEPTFKTDSTNTSESFFRPASGVSTPIWGQGTTCNTPEARTEATTSKNIFASNPIFSTPKEITKNIVTEEDLSSKSLHLTVDFESPSIGGEAEKNTWGSTSDEGKKNSKTRPSEQPITENPKHSASFYNDLDSSFSRDRESIAKESPWIGEKYWTALKKGMHPSKIKDDAKGLLSTPASLASELGAAVAQKVKDLAASRDITATKTSVESPTNTDDINQLVDGKEANSFDRLLTLYGQLTQIMPEEEILALIRYPIIAYKGFMIGAENARLPQHPKDDLKMRNKDFANTMIQIVPSILSSCLQFQRDNLIFELELRDLLANSMLTYGDQKLVGSELLALHEAAPSYKAFLKEKDSMLEELEVEIEAARATTMDNMGLVEELQRANLKKKLDARWWPFPQSAKEDGENKFAREKETAIARRMEFLDRFARATQKLRASMKTGMSLLDTIINNKGEDEKLAKKITTADGQKHVPILKKAYRDALEKSTKVEEALEKLEKDVADAKTTSERTNER